MPAEASDKAAETLNSVGYAEVIFADDVAQILRIKLGRQDRGTDEVAEHNGQLSALD